MLFLVTTFLLSIAQHQTFRWTRKICDDFSPIKIEYPGSGNKSKFVYDARSANVKTVETVSGSVTDTKQFVWCGSIRCEERDSVGAHSKEFFGKGETAAASRYFYSRDHLGSIREMTDGSANIVVQYAFDSFGRLTQLQGSVSTSFHYAGYFVHSRSSLNFTKFRQYKPAIGRWLSRDPLELDADPYTYVLNNPIQLIDPLGLYVYVTVQLNRDGSGHVAISDTPSMGGEIIPQSSPHSSEGYKKNNPNFMADKDTKDCCGGPIPPGTWHLSPQWNYQGGPGFKMYPEVAGKGFDRHGTIMVKPPQGGPSVSRDEFWLGPGGPSHGCLHIDDKDAWEKVKDILNTTSTQMINVEGVQLGSPGQVTVIYGQ